MASPISVTGTIRMSEFYKSYTIRVASTETRISGNLLLFTNLGLGIVIMNVAVAVSITIAILRKSSRTDPVKHNSHIA